MSKREHNHAVGNDDEALLNMQGSTWSSLMWYTLSGAVTARTVFAFCGKPSTVMWVMPL